MLLNGLGDLLAGATTETTRFVDLFAGSGAVAIHVATKYDVSVIASDLQQYSAVLAGAVLERQSELDCKRSGLIGTTEPGRSVADSAHRS
jgi:adenine-specific DNA-methyltransferase